MVHIEWVEITVAEMIDRVGHVRDEFGELCLVLVGHLLACLLARCFLGHLLRLVRLSFESLALVAADECVPRLGRERGWNAMRLSPGPAR